MQIDLEELETKLAALKRERGKATLEGAKFDASKLRDLEDQKAAAHDAEIERNMQARETIRAEAEADRYARFRRVEELEAQRIAAWGAANAATLQLKQAIIALKALTKTQAQVWSQIGDAPSMLQVNDLDMSLGGRVISELSELHGHLAGLGPLQFRGAGGLYKAGSDWAKSEENRLTGHLKILAIEVGHGDSSKKD